MKQKNASTDNLFGLYDLFVGGAFSNAAILALGIMPYISASIILQIAGAVIPYFKNFNAKAKREGKTYSINTLRTVAIALFKHGE